MMQGKSFFEIENGFPLLFSGKIIEKYAQAHPMRQNVSFFGGQISPDGLYYHYRLEFCVFQGRARALCRQKEETICSMYPLVLTVLMFPGWALA